MKRRRRPLLVELATGASSEGLGRTDKTAVAGETTDDLDVPGLKGSGREIPTLARTAVVVEGKARGRTIITEVKGETTDD